MEMYAVYIAGCKQVGDILNIASWLAFAGESKTPNILCLG